MRKWSGGFTAIQTSLLRQGAWTRSILVNPQVVISRARSAELGASIYCQDGNLSIDRVDGSIEELDPACCRPVLRRL